MFVSHHNMVSHTTRLMVGVVRISVVVDRYIDHKDNTIPPQKINLFIWKKGRTFVFGLVTFQVGRKQPTSDFFRDRLSPPVLHSRFEQYKGPTIYLHNQKKFSTMAVAPQYHVTKEEVESSYEFKLMKRILKNEFPWIKDVRTPSEEEINQYSLIFLDIVIDPFILQKELEWPLSSYMKMYMTGRFSSDSNPYVYSSAYLNVMYDILREEAKEVNDEVEKTMRSISTSPAVPQDLKLGKDRNFAIGSFAIPRDIPIPEDAIFTSPAKT